MFLLTVLNPFICPMGLRERPCLFAHLQIPIFNSMTFIRRLIFHYFLSNTFCLFDGIRHRPSFPSFVFFASSIPSSEAIFALKLRIFRRGLLLLLDMLLCDLRSTALETGLTKGRPAEQLTSREAEYPERFPRSVLQGLTEAHMLSILSGRVILNILILLCATTDNFWYPHSFLLS